MKFKPQTETQIADARKQRMKLLDPKLTYDFEVYTATEGKSKSSGNEMFTLTLNIQSEQGTTQVRDYITSTQQDKLFEFCRAIGMLDRYNAGAIEAIDLLDGKGRCRVAIEKGKPNPEGGTYPDRNKIAYYVAPEAGGTPAVAAPADDDDEIPF